MALVVAGGVLWAAPAFTEDVETSAAARIRENAAAVAAMMDSNRDGRISEGEFYRHNAVRAGSRNSTLTATAS
jgi:hypothetical protein